MRPAHLVAASLAILLGACGGPMTETEYVEDLNALVVTAGSDLEASGAAYAQITDPTLEEFVAFVDQQLTAEYEVRDKFNALDPPDSIGEVNQAMVDTLARIITVAEGVVQVADTVDSLEEMEQTPEFAEYYGVNAEADSMCFDVQAKINDLADRPVIDNPWITDLRLTVEAFLDCNEVATG